MSTFTAVITNKGISLQNKQIKGADLVFTKVVSGAGSVPLVDLRTQTAVLDTKQTLAIQTTTINEEQSSYTLAVMLTNIGLETSYELMQIGFYATDPDEGEILFAIAQLDEPKTIESEAKQPNYSLQTNFSFENSNAANIVVNYDSSSFVTRDGVAEMLNAQDYTVEMTEETYVAIEDRISSKKYYHVTDTIDISNGTSTVSNMLLI